MNEKKLNQLFEDYLNGTISPEDERLLESFDAKVLAENLDKYTYAEKAKERVSIKLNTVVGRSTKTRKLWAYTVRVAAAISVFFAFKFIFLQPTSTSVAEEPALVWVERKTDWGEKLNLILADGTQIKLNSGSSIRFPKAFTSDERRIELSGEAFFDVARDESKPFIIQSDQVETKVLGTSFNVQAYEDQRHISVSVLTGRVEVASSENKVFLSPHEQGVYHRSKGNVTKGRVDIEKILLWKDGIIHFEDATFGEVKNVLERWYGVNISFASKELAQCHLTATYANESLETILGSIVYAKKGMQYRMDDQKTIVFSGKCTDN
ncbi:FecR family protein [Roseivirga pacifica]|uniref:FecR family protein n=1 Tax=Roseivirga pacifica TaxID=1267423 RepID=UPI003BAF761D